jgi:hypothetical protein
MMDIAENKGTVVPLLAESSKTKHQNTTFQDAVVLIEHSFPQS